MEKYYQERFEAQRRQAKKIASTMEVGAILELLRAEIRNLAPSAMEACILLLDPDAQNYTRPLQCDLYDRPVNCQSCKRNRPAVQKALNKRKGVVVSKNEPIVRHDGSLVQTGPEAAIPVFVGEDILAVISVVARPGTRFTSKEFFLLKDLSQTAGNAILNAKRHWAVTREKIRMTRMLAGLTPFVPQSVRKMVETSPDMLGRAKEKRDVTVLFLDLEGYTEMCGSHSEIEMNDIVERLFSSVIDPIHRSGGDINETAGDGLMIIFKDNDSKTNAAGAVQAAFDIRRTVTELGRGLDPAQGDLVLNMGISSGTALLGMSRFSGSLHTRMTYTASGMVTNIAARLADLARGGDVLIGQDTAELIDGLWPVYDRGPVRLKGVDRPVNVYSLVRS